MVEKKLPDGWEYKRLDDVSINYDSQRIPVKESDRLAMKGEFPYCGANGVIDFVNEFIFNGEYVLLAEDGGYWEQNASSSYIMSGKFWVNNHAHIIKAKDEVISNQFLSKVLNYLDLRSYITGTTRGKLTQDSMNAISIPVPPIETQRKIVAILDKAEETRRLRTQSNELTQKLLQSVFLEMFGDPVKNPKGWNTQKLGSITSKISSGSTPLGGSNVYSDSGILFIRSQNVHMNRLSLDDAAFISDQIHKEMTRTWVNNGDVLLNITGASIGRVSWFNGEDGKANVNQHVCIIRADRSVILPEFLSYQISMPTFQDKMMSRQSGATRQAFNYSQVADFSVIVPDIAVQMSFSNAVGRINQMTNVQNELSSVIDNVSSLLTSRAFTGELVV